MSIEYAWHPLPGYDRWMDYVSELIWWACNTDEGKPRQMLSGDEVYDEITCGLEELSRKQKWMFSGCAYLCHYVYEHSGLSELEGIGRKYKNNPLSRLAFHPLSEPWDRRQNDRGLEVGDTIQIGSNGDSHVLIVAEADLLQCGEYGQAKGAGFRSISITGDGALCYVGKRPLRRVLRAERLYHHAGASMLAPVPVLRRMGWAGMTLTHKP